MCLVLSNARFKKKNSAYPSSIENRGFMFITQMKSRRFVSRLSGQYNSKEKPENCYFS